MTSLVEVFETISFLCDHVRGLKLTKLGYSIVF